MQKYSNHVGIVIIVRSSRVGHGRTKQSCRLREVVHLPLLRPLIRGLPDEWATTKQACRDELVVYLSFSFIYTTLYFYVLSTVLRKSSFTLYIYIYLFIYLFIYFFITHNMRILFHKAHLYKSIRFIFTCGKGLYSQSEWRTAISHVEV